MTGLRATIEKFVKEPVFSDEPMSRHTTFKAGGPARFYVTVSDADELAAVIRSCRSEGAQYYVIGNGSNLLVKDEGYDGVIIEIGKHMGVCTLNSYNNTVTAQAGASLAMIAAMARDGGLTGFEFASGIPGTVGGACVMNAGAYDGEMKSVLRSVKLMDENGRVTEVPAEELDLSYRHSNIPERGLIVVEAVIGLKPGDRDEISAKMKDLNARRIAKQPLEYPSAGSTFKRPEGFFAGKLIQDAGLMGYTVGGAQVSEKHAGFVINKGGATAADIQKLIADVQEAVFRNSGVRLEREIKLI